MGKKSDPIPFEFNCRNLTDYEIKLSVEVKNKLLEQIFVRAKQNMEKKGYKVDKGLSDITEFDVPLKMLNLLNVGLNKTMKDVRKQTKADGIHILNTKIINAKYKKKEDGEWLVEIIYVGTYMDKR